jgi:hypothetical protein
MATKPDRQRAFVLGVLDGIEHEHATELRRQVGTKRAAAAAESEDLKEWAYRTMKSRTRRQPTGKPWTPRGKRGLYVTLYRSAEALRDVAAVRRTVDAADAELVDTLYRLLCLCAEQGEFLQGAFTGSGAWARQTRGRAAKHENYWMRYLNPDLKLVERALAVRQTQSDEHGKPFIENKGWTTPVARRVIEGLSSTEWAMLTDDASMSKWAKEQRAQKLAELLRARERALADDSEDDYLSDLGPIRRVGFMRTARAFADFASRRSQRSHRV